MVCDIALLACVSDSWTGMATELACTLLAAIVQGVILSALVTKPECLEGEEAKPWLGDEVCLLVCITNAMHRCSTADYGTCS